MIVALLLHTCGSVDNSLNIVAILRDILRDILIHNKTEHMHCHVF